MNNTIDVQNGDAGLAITAVQIDPLHLPTVQPLIGAQISDNRLAARPRTGALAQRRAELSMPTTT